MNILFTICARAGSRGYKNKNVKNFLGQPVSYYTLSAIDLFVKKNSSRYRQILTAVNTDSKQLLRQIKKTNIDFVFVPRKAELASDLAAKIDVIRDTLYAIEKMKGIQIDVIVDLDLTSPLRSLKDIENAIRELNKEPISDLVFTVTDSRRNPYFNMVKEEGPYVSRVIESDYTVRQQAPKVFDMNASIYAYRPEYLKRDGAPGIFDGKAKAIITTDTAVLDIDSEQDFELMRVVGKYFYSRNEALKTIKNNIKEIVQRRGD